MKAGIRLLLHCGQRSINDFLFGPIEAAVNERLNAALLLRTKLNTHDSSHILPVRQTRRNRATKQPRASVLSAAVFRGLTGPPPQTSIFAMPNLMLIFSGIGMAGGLSLLVSALYIEHDARRRRFVLWSWVALVVGIAGAILFA